MVRSHLIGLANLILLASIAAAQNRDYPPRLPDAEAMVYKTIADVKLNAYVFKPDDWTAKDKRPAIVFFFGGGWRSGTPRQFHEQCKYFARRGMVAITADYRVSSRHQTDALACVADAKSAVRWVRKNADQLGVNAQQIVAAGGSAGGHIAACSGIISGLDERSDDISVSSKPNALALFNPALVLASVDGRTPFDADRTVTLQKRIGADPKSASPYHHVAAGAPPTIVFHGIADTTVPFWTAEVFTDAMHKAGNQCELKAYKNQPHGFFNFGRGDGSHYTDTVRSLDEFLVTLGFLEADSSITQ